MDNYKTAGYGGGKIGFGEQAAVLVVDFQLGFTDPSYPAGKSEHIHSAVLHTNNLLELAREKNIPVANCNVAWSGITDMGYWKVTSLYDGSFFKGHKSTEIDPRVLNEDYDFIFTKNIFAKNIFKNYNYHLHVPEGSTPKDGPSAGVTMVTSLVSLLTGISVKPKIAMTGEITLRGNVLPIGGVKEKVTAAHRAGIKEVVLPFLNQKDIEDVPDHVSKDMTFHFAKEIWDVLKVALPEIGRAHV